jgi:hypothetical protein
MRSTVLRVFFLLAPLIEPIDVLAVDAAIPFSRSAYEPVARDKGVVLVSATWARRWRCGSFENAQLQVLGFDRVGSQKTGISDKPDIVIEDGSLLPASQSFANLALLVEPGEYLFSTYKIKAVKSLSQVGYFSGDRTTLISEGKSKAGSFSIGAGEIVYIGHFALDCAQAPMPWRYYPEDRPSFSKYLEVVLKEYPGLPVEQAKFRLFETTVMGIPFRLPE